MPLLLSWNTVSQVLPPDIANWDLYKLRALAEEGGLEMAPIKADGKDVLRNGSVSLWRVNSRVFEASAHKQRRHLYTYIHTYIHTHINIHIYVYVRIQLVICGHANHCADVLSSLLGSTFFYQLVPLEDFICSLGPA